MSIVICEGCDRPIDLDKEETYTLDNDMAVCENCYNKAQD